MYNSRIRFLYRYNACGNYNKTALVFDLVDELMLYWVMYDISENKARNMAVKAG